MQCKTRYSPKVGFLLPYTFFAFKRSLRCLIFWMLSIGRARHPGPGTSSYPSGFCIEFLNVGGWLSRGDLALGSSADFLAVAEHRLVPARARTVTTQLRQARRSSVWHPLVRMLLLVAMRGLASSWCSPFPFLPFSIPPLRSSFVLVVL